MTQERANLHLVFPCICLPLLLSADTDSSVSAAHACVFELPPKVEAGALFQRGELLKRAALPRQVWQQDLGRDNDSKRNRELKIQKERVPSFFCNFF